MKPEFLKRDLLWATFMSFYVPVFRKLRPSLVEQEIKNKEPLQHDAIHLISQIQYGEAHHFLKTSLFTDRKGNIKNLISGDFFWLSFKKKKPEYSHFTILCYCVRFCYTTKWISYMYTYILSLLNLPLKPHHTQSRYHREPSWAPCDIQQVPTSYLF